MQDEQSSINSEFQSINGIISCVDQDTHKKSTFELGTDEETFGSLDTTLKTRFLYFEGNDVYKNLLCLAMCL